MDSSKCDKQEEHVSDNDSGFIIFVPTHSSSKKEKGWISKQNVDGGRGVGVKCKESRRPGGGDARVL